MNPFFAYLIKSSISLTVLYCLFRFTMRNDRSHTTNRFLLLGILFVSAIIPFLNIQFFYEEIPLKTVETIREFVSAPVYSTPVLSETIQPAMEASSLPINWGLVFYISVSSVLFLRLIFGVFQVTKIIKRAEKRRLQEIVLAVVKELIQPFSFLNKVVLSEKDFIENKNIVVTHEHAHIKQLHAIDLMVCELFTLMQFFNPFMWLLRRDLKLIHEYQADEAVLNKGIDAQKYQLLVLEKAVGERRFAMANYFTQKPLLKRLKMMQQNNRKQLAALKLILFVPILLLLLQAFARPELITTIDDFIPVKYTENDTNNWLQKWTVENIGRGVFHPYGVKVGEFPSGSKNKLRIGVYRNNRIMFGQQSIEVSEIKEYFNRCLQGYNPVKGEELESNEKDIPELGKVSVTELLVHFSYDKMLSTDSVNPVLKLLGEAYFETKQNLAQKYFKQDYLELDEVNAEIIDLAVPIRFSCSHMVVYKSHLVEITLQKNGKIYAWSQEYTIEELEQELIKEKAILAKPDKDGYRYSLLPDLKVEDGVSENQIAQLKEMLRKANIVQVNFSRIKPSLPIKSVVQASRNYIKINETNYSIGKVLLGKESHKESGKFEIDLFHNISEEGTSILLYSIKSKSKDKPDIGTYKYVNLNHNKQDYFNFYGKVKKGGKELSILEGSFEILNNSTENFAISFNIKLKNGDEVSGRYNGKVDYKEWGKDDRKHESETIKSKPPQPINIRLDKNGELYIGKYHFTKEEGRTYILWNKNISHEELKELISKKRHQLEEINKKMNTKHELITSVVAENGVKESDIKQLKEVLRESKVQNINYRTTQ